jgi:hypothetical protein
MRQYLLPAILSITVEILYSDCVNNFSKKTFGGYVLIVIIAPTV